MKGFDHMVICKSVHIGLQRIKRVDMFTENLFISLFKNVHLRFVLITTTFAFPSLCSTRTVVTVCFYNDELKTAVVGNVSKPNCLELGVLLTRESTSLSSFSSTVTGRVIHPPICVIGTSGSHSSSRM